MHCERLRRLDICRSPYGERGLKYKEDKAILFADASLSLRRAWIEIMNCAR